MSAFVLPTWLLLPSSSFHISNASSPAKSNLYIERNMLWTMYSSLTLGNPTSLQWIWMAKRISSCFRISSSAKASNAAPYLSGAAHIHSGSGSDSLARIFRTDSLTSARPRSSHSCLRLSPSPSWFANSSGETNDCEDTSAGAGAGAGSSFSTFFFAGFAINSSSSFFFDLIGSCSMLSMCSLAVGTFNTFSVAALCFGFRSLATKSGSWRGSSSVRGPFGSS
mmetsp:Transcript_1851/g.4570  ORF Transcript_1851/g.4570 Transcript_1851/m.4570 type:complete len:223 (-) Transcript_1851:512-1180(-)